jgi:hypothetical protein
MKMEKTRLQLGRNALHFCSSARPATTADASDGLVEVCASLLSSQHSLLLENVGGSFPHMDRASFTRASLVPKDTALESISSVFHS